MALKFFWILLFCIHHVTCKSPCSNITSCQCFEHGKELEFQCPMNYPTTDKGLLMHLKEDGNRFTIDCKSDPLNLTLMLDLKGAINKVELLKISSCTFTSAILEDFFHLFRTNVTILEIEYSNFTVEANLNSSQFAAMTSLKLRRSRIENLDNFLQFFPKLISLELQEIDLQPRPNMFDNNTLLKWLDLSGNGIAELPDRLFKPLKNLGKLHLWDNDLTTITESTFEGLFNLNSLELSANKIQNISKDAFNDLSNLTQISLHSNNLRYLPPGLFRHNLKITNIALLRNPLDTLPDYLFSNMTFLQNLSLDKCRFEKLPSHLFHGVVHIKTLNLSGNKLKDLPADLFANLKDLEELDLSRNNLSNMPEDIFKGLTKLKTLKLNNNEIFYITSELFQDLSALTELNLERNKIRYITHNAFYGMGHLKKFNMAWNEYENGEQSVDWAILGNNLDLEEVFLAHNSLRDVSSFVDFVNKVHLKLLDVSYNRVSFVDVGEFQSVSTSMKVVLEHNEITEVFFKTAEIFAKGLDLDAHSITQDYPHSVLYLENNPIKCDCKNYDFLRYVLDEIDPNIKVLYDLRYDDLSCDIGDQNITFSQVPPLLLTCPLSEFFNSSACPSNCSCSWRPYDRAILIDCTGLRLTSFPNIELPNPRSISYNQTILDLDDNLLTKGPNETIKGIFNVTELTLSRNQITSFDWIPAQLKILKLDNNKLTNLHWPVLELMNSSSLGYLKLENNPWSCGCESYDFSNFLKQHTREINVNKVVCNSRKTPLFNLNRNDLCPEWSMLYTVLLVVTFLFVAAFISALYYCYEREVKVWLYAKGWLLWWVTEDEIDKEKKYDAFISYSHKDEEFVTQNLQPILESGPNPYKLCLHYRNFIPGESILQQIVHSVKDSRRTVVVLSPNFLESVWGKLEFRTAHTEAMSEGRARVIVILYGEVDVKKLDPELQSYLKTNTYVQWGDPYFWNKLRYALPHSKRISVNKKNQKIANMMNFIDDKFNLMVPNISSNPNSTPPVLTLEVGGLEKNYKEENGKLFMSNDV